MAAPRRQYPKLRPVLVIQSDLRAHASTWVLPCTTRLVGENLLRVELHAGAAGNRQHCEIMMIEPSIHLTGD